MKLSLAQMKRRGDGRAQLLYVRISHLGYVRYVSLGYSVRPKDWNPRAQEVRASHDDQDNLNRLLKARLATAKAAAAEVVLTGGKRTAVEAVKEAVQDVLHPQAPVSVSVPAMPWLRAEVQRAYRDRGKESTALAYASILNRLQETLESKRLSPSALPFQALTYDLLARHRDRVAEKHAVNYVHKQITTLRALLARAERAGVPGAADALAAAKRVQVKKERVERVRVPLSTVEAYGELPLTGRAADVRDWWRFAFYAGGVRLGDVCRLRWSDVERDAAQDGLGAPVAYRMRQQKTGQPMMLPLVDEAAEILRRWEPRTLAAAGASVEASPYVFGLLTEADEADPAALRKAVDRRGAVARRYLERVSKAEGWPRLGFHTARHSLADHMRKGGADLYDISKVLGHTKLSTTESYLASFDADSAGAALRGAFGKGSGGA